MSNLLKAKTGIHYAVKSNGSLVQSVKDVDLTKRVVTGFFNTYNVLDSDDDIIVKGALTKSYNERGVNSNATAKIKHCIQHDLNRICGKLLVLEDRKIDGIEGVYFETKMADTQLGRDTLINYQEGIYDNHSIGFRYVQGEIVEKKAGQRWDDLRGAIHNPEAMDGKEVVFVWKELMMYEGSTVAFGANSLTPFLGVKSGNRQAIQLAIVNRIDAMEKAIKHGFQSDEMLAYLEVQARQLKQAVQELAEAEPTEKQKLSTGAEGEQKEGAAIEETKDEQKEYRLDASSLVEKLSFGR